MKRVKVSFEAQIDDEFLEELNRIVDHHLDYLIDLDDNPEIKELSDGEVEELDWVKGM